MNEVKGLLPERRRLIGSRRRLVVTVHIVAALSLLGTSTVLAVGGVHAARGDDPQDAHAIYTLLRQLTLGLDLPLAAITLFSGVALALTSKWGIFRYWWVTAKLALYLLILGLGVILIGPSIDTMLDATSTSNPGESSARVRLPLFAGVQVALLLAAATLGVFKPERRVRRPQLARPLVLGKKSNRSAM